jgi:hypothetical protein
VRPANTQSKGSQNSTSRYCLSAVCSLLSTLCCLLSTCWCHGRDRQTYSGRALETQPAGVVCLLSVVCYLLSDVCFYCLLSPVGKHTMEHNAILSFALLPWCYFAFPSIALTFPLPPCTLYMQLLSSWLYSVGAHLSFINLYSPSCSSLFPLFVLP